MSGGSWDYMFKHLEEAADRLIEEKETMRRALGYKMHLMAQAMHDIEWVDSSDYGKCGDVRAIRQIVSEEDIRKVLVHNLKTATKELQDFEDNP